MPPVPSWPPTSPRVAYFRDPFGTYYAAEIHACSEWRDGLTLPPSVALADVRLLLLRPGEAPPGNLPPWVAVAGTDTEAAAMASAVAHAWPHSPHFRGPGDPPDAYVVAGFQALCPPHPPCDAGPHARESLVGFLRDRPGLLGEIAEEGRDAFDRRLRVHWADAAAFAREVLAERLRDAGASRALGIVERCLDAKVAGDAASHRPLVEAREALRPRLDLVRYFLAPRDFDAALGEAEAWTLRYRRDLAVFHERMAEEGIEVLRDVTPAVSSVETLERYNRASRPVGVEASRRLVAAVQEIQALVRARGDVPPETLVLGRTPPAFGEARLAAAAVMAAVDVQRRRAALRPAAADHTA